VALDRALWDQVGLGWWQGSRVLSVVDVWVWQWQECVQVCWSKSMQLCTTLQGPMHRVWIHCVVLLCRLYRVPLETRRPMGRWSSNNQPACKQASTPASRLLLMLP
jgi:hypothetical protein